MSALQFKAQLGLTYKTAWLLTQKLRRSMVDPEREPLEGVVEIDQAEIPFRADDTFFDPVKSGKILVAGAVEVIDRGASYAKPRRKGTKYLDTRSGRIRLAAISDNSAASLEAFVRANVKPGTTLLTDGHRSYPGLTDYRHDPRTVGKMAGHIVLPWIHRVFSLMKRWGLGTYHGLRRKHIDTYLNEFVFRYNRRFYRHVSFETVLGLASRHQPTSYWDIIGRDNPRKGAIDNTDHFSHVDPRLSRVHFLTWSDAKHHLIWSLARGGENRLRHHEYADLFRRNGYEVIASDAFIDEKVLQGISRLKLAAPYNRMTAEQIAAVTSWYVLRTSTSQL
jgi:transposase-like protein